MHHSNVAVVLYGLVVMLSCGFGGCFVLHLRNLTVAGASECLQTIGLNVPFDYCSLDQLPRGYVFESASSDHLLVWRHLLGSSYRHSECSSMTFR